MKNNYEVRGPITVVFLKRKNGEVLEMLIDTDDLELVKCFPYTWYANKSIHTGQFYVRGYINKVNGNERKVEFSRWLLRCQKGVVVDHINHNTLDNRRENLRIVTHAENMQNRKTEKGNSSGYRGVGWHKASGKWRARLMVQGKRIELGLFEELTEAVNTVKEARMKHMPYSSEFKGA